MKLHVVLEQDEAGYFVAEVPALPGCLSQGKTRDEAIGNVKDAIEGWLEVMEAKQKVDVERMVEVVVCWLNAFGCVRDQTLCGNLNEQVGRSRGDEVRM